MLKFKYASQGSLKTLSSSADPITSRSSRLNQVFQGRVSLCGQQAGCSLGREEFVEALLLLYQECTSPELMKIPHVANFVNNFSEVVSELRALQPAPHDFELRAVVGRGRFAEVQVVREKSTRDVCALKVMSKTVLRTQENVIFHEEERKILSLNSSPWIPQLLYAFQDKDNVYLLTKLCSLEYLPLAGGQLLSELAAVGELVHAKLTKAAEQNKNAIMSARDEIFDCLRQLQSKMVELESFCRMKDSLERQLNDIERLAG